MTVATHTAAGYRATRTETALIVHDVPIFSACERGDFVADERWVKSAVSKALAEARENYHPPLHIRHHEPSTDMNDSVRAAGWFEVTGVQPITLSGKRRNAVFANLHITDPAAQEEVMSSRLPYRSVEIFDVDAPPSIDGLALLDHEAPFLRLPMLMVGELDDRAPKGATGSECTLERTGGDIPVVAWFRKGRYRSLLFREETPMTTKTKEPETETPEFGTGVTPDENFNDDDKPKKDDDNGENAEGDDSALDVGAVVKAIASGSISIADMDAILEAIQSQGGEAEPEPDETPAPAAAPGAEAMRARKEPDEKFAAMQGRIDGLEAKATARDQQDARVADVAEAMHRLETKPMGADLEERLGAFHKDHGPAAFKAYVDSLAQAVGEMPGEDGKMQRFMGQSGVVPEVAMKYQKQGTDAVDQAAKFCAEWKELQGRGLTVTQENYVAGRMKATAAPKEN